MPETKYTAERPSLETVRMEIPSPHKTSEEVDIAEKLLVPKRNLWENVAVFPQVEWHLNWFKLFCRPFVLLTFPTVLWVRRYPNLSHIRVVSSTEWPYPGV
jgi:hypothetical protein